MISTVRITGDKAMKIDFLDLKRQEHVLSNKINAAVKRVLKNGYYILGKEVIDFEAAFASYARVKYAIGVGSGTEALHLSMVACGIKQGDEVITAANTCGPTISAILASGATVVLADIDPGNYCLDVDSIENKITKKTKAIIPVHLYGQTAGMSSILRLSRRYHIPVIEDCAQAHGAKHKDKMAGSMGAAGAFSFYPTKNLGAMGDAGMITTNIKSIADKCRLLRNYGQKTRYRHSLAGFNSRLDEMQAAILKAKLGYLTRWNNKRRAIAQIYSRRINNPDVMLPKENRSSHHVYHLYVVQVKSREKFQRFLSQHGIASLIHYPIPIHRQEFYRRLYGNKENFPVTDRLSRKIVSLPLYPYLTDKEIGYIVKTVNSYRP